MMTERQQRAQEGSHPVVPATRPQGLGTAPPCCLHLLLPCHKPRGTKEPLPHKAQGTMASKAFCCSQSRMGSPAPNPQPHGQPWEWKFPCGTGTGKPHCCSLPATGVLPYSFPTSVHQFVPPTEFIHMYVHLRPSLASAPSGPLQYAKGCMVVGTQHRQALPSLWCCCMKLKEDGAEIACTSASMLFLLIYLENTAQVPIQQRKQRLHVVCANCIAIPGSFVHGEVGVKPSLLMRECDKGQEQQRGFRHAQHHLSPEGAW